MNSKSWGPLILKYFNIKIRGKGREERKQTAHVGGNLVKRNIIHCLWECSLVLLWIAEWRLFPKSKNRTTEWTKWFSFSASTSCKTKTLIQEDLYTVILIEHLVQWKGKGYGSNQNIYDTVRNGWIGNKIMIHWHNRMHAILRKYENLKFAGPGR